MHKFPSPTERSEFAAQWRDATPEMRQAVLEILRATMTWKPARDAVKRASAADAPQAGEARGHKWISGESREEELKRWLDEFGVVPQASTAGLTGLKRGAEEHARRERLERKRSELRENLKKLLIHECPACTRPNLGIDARRKAAKRRAMRWAKACDARNRVLEQRKADDRQRKMQWAVWLLAIYVLVTAVVLKIHDVITAPSAAPSPGKPGIIERGPRRMDEAVPGIWWHEVEDKQRESDDDSSMENQGLGPGTPVQVDLGPDEELI